MLVYLFRQAFCYEIGLEETGKEDGCVFDWGWKIRVYRAHEQPQAVRETGSLNGCLV